MASSSKKTPPSSMVYHGDENEAIQALSNHLSNTLAVRPRRGLQPASHDSNSDHVQAYTDDFYVSRVSHGIVAIVPDDASSSCDTDPDTVLDSPVRGKAVFQSQASCDTDPDTVPDSPVRGKAVFQSQASCDNESSSDKLIPLVSSSNTDTSSDSSGGSNAGTSSDSSGGVCNTNEADIDMRRGKPLAQPAQSAGGFTGFMCYVLPDSDHVHQFVTKLRDKQYQSGIYSCNGLELHSVSSNQVEYKEGKHFRVTSKPIHHSDVFLCQDISSGLRFILKKIKSVNGRLVGLEFLTKHRQDFLPKIYGVFKEKDVIWIFQECIEGGTVKKCAWSPLQIYQFGVRLLTSCKYLHGHGLAHFDIKLMNLMVRDINNPESLVFIDFESAKHGNPAYKFGTAGYTIFYLPPWHEDIFCLKAYDDIVKTADLWAIACVLVFLLLPSDRSDLQHNSHFLWTTMLREIQQSCKSRCEGLKLCEKCRSRFLHNLKVNGREILTIHLKRMMGQNNNNPHWVALQNTLLYLTNCDNVRQKNVDEALRILTDLPRYTQSSIEEDIVIHQRQHQQ